MRTTQRQRLHRSVASLCEDSPLRKADPRLKLVLTLLVTTAVMLPLPRLLIFVPTFVLLLAYARLLPQAAHQVRRIAWFLVGIFVLDWAFVGIELAITITFRLVTMVSASVLLFGTTTPEEFRKALQSLGLPYRYSFALSLAFQSIPLISAQWRAIREAQQARGALPERHGWRQWPARLRDLVALAVPAVVLTTRRAWTLTEAAYARGFGSPRASVSRPFLDHSLHWQRLALVAGMLAWVLFLGLCR